jgi:hypothetical protein
MALVHSLVVDAQIKNPKLRTFLHQRAREWRFSDLSTNPRHCTELPVGFDDDAREDSPLAVTSSTKADKHIAWNEDLPKASALSGITDTLYRLAPNMTPAKKDEPTEPASPASDSSTNDWTSGQAAICPTFAGGPVVTGECMLTNPAVQDAILSFFEEVAQDPQHYRNPIIKVHTLAPQPTVDNPLVLDPDNPKVAAFPSLPPEMSPDQAELDCAKEKLEQMQCALQACSANVPELTSGRTNLVERIVNQEAKIEKLEKKALATGGLTAGEAQQKRENWQPPKEGPKVKFAGTMVDSELLKAAGLGDTVEELLELGEEDE